MFGGGPGFGRRGGGGPMGGPMGPRPWGWRRPGCFPGGCGCLPFLMIIGLVVFGAVSILFGFHF